jgi:hypothetical protein
MADVIDEFEREQPAPMARLVRIRAGPQAAGQGHARALEILAALEADRVRSRPPARAG